MKTIKFIILICLIIKSSTSRVRVSYCKTEKCNNAAEYIKSLMNTTADPCTNMYEYSCGNWMSKYKNNYGSSVMNDLKNEVNQLIMSKIKGMDVSSLKSTYLHRIANYIFKQCMNVRDLSLSESLRLLNDALQYVFHDYRRDSWEEVFFRLWIRTGTSPIFNIYINHNRILHISPHKEDHSPIKVMDYETIKLKKRDFNLNNTNNAASNEENEEIESKRFNMTVDSFMGIYKLMSENPEFEFSNPSWLLTIESVVKFGQDIERILKRNYANRADIRLLTTTELSIQTSYDWNNFINQLFLFTQSPITPEDDFEIAVVDLQSIQEILQLISGTDREVLRNYQSWQAIIRYGSLISDDLRQILPTFMSLNGEVDENRLLTREEYCQHFIMKEYPLVPSRLFIMNFINKTDQEEASYLASNVLQSFYSFMSINRWLGEETRAKALAKLEKMSFIVGYNSWYLNNRRVDISLNLHRTIYKEIIEDQCFPIGHMKYRENTLMELVVYLLQDIFFNEYGRLKNIKKFVKPEDVGAVFVPQANRVEIGGGLIQFPIFQANRPPALNYGGLGTLIGHEIAHAFDDDGTQYNENGKKYTKPFWSNDDLMKAYSSLKECFIKDFSSIIVPGSNIKLNATKILFETIADLTGLKAAHEALLKTEQSEQKVIRLNQLSQFGSEQLFFISWAQNWCEITDPNDYSSDYKYLPAKYRVERILANYPSFANAFKCKPNKNPCRIW